MHRSLNQINTYNVNKSLMEYMALRFKSINFNIKKAFDGNSNKFRFPSAPLMAHISLG